MNVSRRYDNPLPFNSHDPWIPFKFLAVTYIKAVQVPRLSGDVKMAKKFKYVATIHEYHTQTDKQTSLMTEADFAKQSSAKNYASWCLILLNYNDALSERENQLCEIVVGL